MLIAMFSTLLLMKNKYKKKSIIKDFKVALFLKSEIWNQNQCSGIDGSNYFKLIHL